MSDSAQFENSLEAALQRAATSPADRPAFYRELLASRVLIIPAEMPDMENGRIKEGQALKLSALEHEGKQYVPFFTSASRIQGNSPYLELGARNFFEMTRGARLVLNPGSRYGKEFAPEEVEAMLSGKMFEPEAQYETTKDEQIIIGQPAQVPHAVLAELSKFFATQASVKRAWLGWYHQPSREQKPGYLLAIEAKDAIDFRELSGLTGVVLKGAHDGKDYIDIVKYTKGGLSDYFTKQKPFYKASLWRRLLG